MRRTGNTQHDRCVAARHGTRLYGWRKCLAGTFVLQHSLVSDSQRRKLHLHAEFDKYNRGMPDGLYRHSNCNDYDRLPGRHHYDHHRLQRLRMPGDNTKSTTGVPYQFHRDTLQVS
jgi:hypothetical protein